MRRETHAKTPIRTCIVCRSRRPKSELLRHVFAAQRRCDAQTESQARMTPDPKAILAGRGYYLCGDPNCRERFAATAQRRRKRSGGE